MYNYNIQGQYLKIKQAVDRLLSGESTPEELMDFLERTMDHLEPKGQLIRTTLDHEGYRDWAVAESEAGESGVEHYEEGLVSLLELLDAGDHEGLLEALRMIKEGNDLINRAMTLNRDADEERDLKIIL